MIFFENNREFLLCPADYSQFESYLTATLGEEEQVLATFREVHDGYVFTDSRILAVDIQRMLGTKADVSSLLYKSVEAFAADRTPEGGVLELFLAGQKRLTFSFAGGCDLSPLSAAISRYTL